MDSTGRWVLWLDPLPRPGYLNMAIDEALLAAAEASGAGFLRLYRWEPFCLSFGRHEPAARRYRRDRIAALGLDAVRRPTGGRAVWHARELTYAVAAPQAAFGSAPAAYLGIHRTIAAALADLGAATTLAPRGPQASPAARGPCFAAPVGGEVVAGGRKLVGSAQLLRGGALLQHGSVLLEGDQRTLGEVAAGPVPPGRETSLRAVLGRPVGFEEVAGALAGRARSWGAWEALEDPEPILRQAGPLSERYRSDAWTWSR